MFDMFWWGFNVADVTHLSLWTYWLFLFAGSSAGKKGMENFLWGAKGNDSLLTEGKWLNSYFSKHHAALLRHAELSVLCVRTITAEISWWTRTLWQSTIPWLSRQPITPRSHTFSGFRRLIGGFCSSRPRKLYKICRASWFVSVCRTRAWQEQMEHLVAFLSDLK